ncbi:MAG: transposase [Methylocystis sp.]|nr:transposase [Methylocystis sp.]
MTEPYLDEARWAQIERRLPGKRGDPGRSGADNRLFIEAVFWIIRTNAPWRDLPPEFGKWFTTYTRFRRWAKKGVWPGVFAALGDDQTFETALVGKKFRKILAGNAAAERQVALPADRAAA